MKKYLIIIVFMFCMLCSCSVIPGGVEYKEKAYTIEKQQKYNMYSDVDVIEGEMEATFFDNYKNVCYVNAKEFFNFYKTLASNTLYDDNISYTFKVEDNSILITRENGATCLIDSSNDIIDLSSFFDFSKSSQSREAEFIFDAGKYLSTDKNNVNLYYSDPRSFAIKTSTHTLIDFGAYNLDIICYHNEIYIPFQIMSNIFYSLSYQIYTFLTDGFYITDQYVYSKEYFDYYASKSIEITEDLLYENYYETCLLLDYFYGLKEFKIFNSFDEAFIAAGLKEEALKSPDGFDTMIDYALNKLIDDGHTAFGTASQATSEAFKQLSYGPSVRKLLDNYTDVYYNRLEYLGTSFDQYVEMGNTAIITFDSFDEPTYDYYETGIPNSLEEVGDSVELFIYAYKMITRADSPIEHIVIDISANGGGDTRSLTYMLGFILDRVTICENVTVDNLQLFSTYQSDCNLDGKVDNDDKLLLDKDIFVLTSGYSYSCANIFANICKENGIPVLGRTSGGGACAVSFAVSSIGTTYQYSGPLRFERYNNGIYENIDNGALVDYTLGYNQMYNRDLLIHYLLQVIEVDE